MGEIPAGPAAVDLAELITLSQHDRARHAVTEHDRDLPGCPGTPVGGARNQESASVMTSTRSIRANPSPSGTPSTAIRSEAI